MMKRRHGSAKPEAELDITSFMNLMIVLVPVLLLNMVFSHITILELNLPPASSAPATPDKNNKDLELLISKQRLALYYPSGTLIATIEQRNKAYDFSKLSTYLQDVKRQLQSAGQDKKDIILLSAPDVDYQTIVSVMDAVRSYQAVVAAEVVNAELFPDISLGDAPVSAQAPGGQ